MYSLSRFSTHLALLYLRLLYFPSIFKPFPSLSSVIILYCGFPRNSLIAFYSLILLLYSLFRSSHPLKSFSCHLCNLYDCLHLQLNAFLSPDPSICLLIRHLNLTPLHLICLKLNSSSNSLTPVSLLDQQSHNQPNNKSLAIKPRVIDDSFFSITSRFCLLNLCILCIPTCSVFV